MMWRGVWFCACVHVLYGLGRGEDAPLATVRQGALRGALFKSRGGRQYSAFQGIPYAAAPLGDLRFRAPQPPASWEGEKDASRPGSPCLQSNLTSLGKVFGSEDCLYLNVYTHKATNESKTHVLVYIHGGGFFEGRGDFQRPDFLMDNDIVFVTINYRLGPLGFLSFEDKYLPGNYGMKDQTAALRWVRDNVGQFGGDPGSVTVWGESAGAASVHLLMLSPLSRDLFQQAISQSGTAYCPWASHSPGQLRTTSQHYAAEFSCNHESTQDTLNCLRDMPAYVLVEVANSFHEWHNDPVIMFPPAVEPVDAEEPFLTSDPWTLTSDKPWITGITSGEGAFKSYTLDKSQITELNEDFEMIGPVTLMFRKSAHDPEHTALTIKKFYFLDSDITPESIEGLTNMYSDSWFTYPALESFRRHRGPKYFYFFDYRGENSQIPQFKDVSHFDDMQYYFPMDHYYKNFNTSAEDNKMSEKLINFWINFVIQGKPTLATSSIVWTEAATGTEYLHIQREGFVMKQNLLKDRDTFWSKLQYREKYLNDGRNKDEL